MNLNDIWGIQEIINNLSPAAKVGDFLYLYMKYTIRYVFAQPQNIWHHIMDHLIFCDTNYYD